MITRTFDKLATITLANNANSITFSSLPTSYRDLVLMGQFNLTNTLEAFRIYFNSDYSGGNYNVALIGGNGSAASGGASNGSMVYYRGAGTGALAMTMNIMDYTDTNKYVMTNHMIAEPGQWVGHYVNRWLSNTAAVTDITLKCDLSNISAGSTFSLYGVA